MDPLVSIGVPNFNGSKFISETLDSLKKLDYSNLEIIVVDDCSTDSSVELIENWINENVDINIKLLIHDQNQGPCAACNTFFTNCKGEYFQYVGSDDLLYPFKIKEQVNLLESLGENYGFIYTDVHVINDFGEILYSSYLSAIGYKPEDMPFGYIFSRLLEFNFISSPSPLIRKKCAQAVGGFNTAFWLEDYDLWLRLAKQYKVAYSSKPSAAYRKNSKSLTNTSSSWIKIVEEALRMRFKFYETLSEEEKKLFNVVLNKEALILYSYEHESSKYWLKQSYLHSKDIKSLLLYLLSNLGVKYKNLLYLKEAFIL